MSNHDVVKWLEAEEPLAPFPLVLMVFCATFVLQHFNTSKTRFTTTAVWFHFPGNICTKCRQFTLFFRLWLFVNTFSPRFTSIRQRSNASSRLDLTTLMRNSDYNKSSIPLLFLCSLIGKHVESVWLEKHLNVSVPMNNKQALSPRVLTVELHCKNDTLFGDKCLHFLLSSDNSLVKIRPVLNWTVTQKHSEK